jgi:hypothetical protein
MRLTEFSLRRDVEFRSKPLKCCVERTDRYGLSATCSCHVLREASCLNVTAFV